MSIRVHCNYTGSLPLKGRWPTEVCCRPMVGDYICTVGGEAVAKIVKVTHSVMNPEARNKVAMLVLTLDKA